MDDVAMDFDAVEESSAPQAARSTTNSAKGEYSTTNIQKEGVDEPDILKTDGKYFYYYNAETDKIHIINSPLDINTQTVNLDRVDILTEIIVPESLYDIELLFYGDELIIVASRYSQ